MSNIYNELLNAKDRIYLNYNSAKKLNYVKVPANYTASIKDTMIKDIIFLYKYHKISLVTIKYINFLFGPKFLLDTIINHINSKSEKTLRDICILEGINILDIDFHCSDLYISVNEISTKVINNYEFKCNVTTFNDQKTGKLWYDVPFAFSEYYYIKNI